MNSNAEYLEIDMIRLLKALWKRIWIIILSALLCAEIGFAYANYIITPLYKSSVLMYVNNSSFSLRNTSFSFSSSDLTAAQSLVDTYIIILKTRTTLDTVISRAGVDYSYEQLEKMVEAEAVNGTEVFEITVTSDDPQEAQVLAKTIASVLPGKVAAVVDGSSVRVVDYAVVPTKKDSPNITLYTAAGLMLGLIISCAIVVILELMDDLVHDEEFLTQNFDIPMLASIPDAFSNNGASYTKYGPAYHVDKE